MLCVFMAVLRSVHGAFVCSACILPAHVYQMTDGWIGCVAPAAGQFPIRDSKRLCTHLLDAAVAALPPGQEQIIGVFDLRQFDLRNADFMFAEFMIEAFFKYYPRRWVGRTCFVRCRCVGLLWQDVSTIVLCVCVNHCVVCCAKWGPCTVPCAAGWPRCCFTQASTFP
jgi:hypothetical protein